MNPLVILVSSSQLRDEAMLERTTFLILIAVALMAGCPDPAESSCVRASDCPSGLCVDGRCQSAPDASADSGADAVADVVIGVDAPLDATVDGDVVVDAASDAYTDPDADAAGIADATEDTSPALCAEGGAPQPENCDDGIDNDCDGVADDGCCFSSPCSGVPVNGFCGGDALELNCTAASSCDCPEDGRCTIHCPSGGCAVKVYPNTCWLLDCPDCTCTVELPEGGPSAGTQCQQSIPEA